MAESSLESRQKRRPFFQELLRRTNKAEAAAALFLVSQHPRRRLLHQELRSTVETLERKRGLGHTERSVRKQSFDAKCTNLERKFHEQRQKRTSNRITPPTTNPTLYNALMEHDWDRALLCLRTNPELARYHHPRGGWYPLHLVCSRGSSPLPIVQALVEAYPLAVNLRTPFKFRDTPLHIQSRNSQGSSSKIKALLPYADLRLVNLLGHTALHTACGTNAIIDVLQYLIANDETLLNVRDIHGQTPLDALWASFLQSIPGHLTVGRILRGDTHSISESFRRFWDKVQLLVLRGNAEHTELGHAMLQLAVPAKMLQVALQLDPQLASQPDGKGNNLLHKMILCRLPFHQDLFELASNEETLQSCNKQGETILSLAIKHEMMEYIAATTNVAPLLLAKQDSQTRLYPFQLAAANDCSATLIYSLLIEQPEVIQY